MELRTHERKDTFEDIVEDQILDEDMDTFYTSSMEEDLYNKDFYDDLKELETLLELSVEDLRNKIKEDEDLTLLFEKNEIDLEDENIKEELREMTLTLELINIDNVLSKYLEDSIQMSEEEDLMNDIEISEEKRREPSLFQQFKENVSGTKRKRKKWFGKGRSYKGPRSSQNFLMEKISSYIESKDTKFTKWWTSTKFYQKLQKVPFYKRKSVLISAGIMIATVISLKIYHDRSFILNPRFYKDKMARLKKRNERYNPSRVIKAVPANVLSELKRNTLSSISNMERLVDDIINGENIDRVYIKLANLNLGLYGMSFDSKRDGRLKVKRRSINRKIKLTTAELGYSNMSYNSLVKDLNEIREKFLKTHEKVIDLQIKFLEDPSRYENIKEATIKKFLPSLITILKYVFNTVFRDFYNTAYAIK